MWCIYTSCSSKQEYMISKGQRPDFLTFVWSKYKQSASQGGQLTPWPPCRCPCKLGLWLKFCMFCILWLCVGHIASAWCCVSAKKCQCRWWSVQGNRVNERVSDDLHQLINSLNEFKPFWFSLCWNRCASLTQAKTTKFMHIRVYRNNTNLIESQTAKWYITVTKGNPNYRQNTLDWKQIFSPYCTSTVACSCTCTYRNWVKWRSVFIGMLTRLTVVYHGNVDVVCLWACCHDLWWCVYG